MKKIVQTAGRNALNEFAPQFAHFNDDVLFGENWNNQDIDVKTRCIITVTALIASGMINTSLVHHFENAKAHGVTQKEIAAVITHIAFYAGWPKGYMCNHGCDFFLSHSMSFCIFKMCKLWCKFI